MTGIPPARTVVLTAMLAIAISAAALFGDAVTGTGPTKPKAMTDANSNATEIAKERHTCITRAKLEDVVKDPDEPGWWIATAYVANHAGSCANPL